jgi:chromosome segregation ATPase
MQGNAPVYVRIQEYEEVLTTLDAVKRKLADAHNQLTKLQGLKAEEDKEIASWAASLDAVTERLNTLETNLKQ